jgi:hypothetical protein
MPITTKGCRGLTQVSQFLTKKEKDEDFWL